MPGKGTSSLPIICRDSATCLGPGTARAWVRADKRGGPRGSFRLLICSPPSEAAGRQRVRAPLPSRGGRVCDAGGGAQ